MVFLISIRIWGESILVWVSPWESWVLRAVLEAGPISLKFDFCDFFTLTGAMFWNSWSDSKMAWVKTLSCWRPDSLILTETSWRFLSFLFLSAGLMTLGISIEKAIFDGLWQWKEFEISIRLRMFKGLKEGEFSFFQFFNKITFWMAQ